MVEIKKGKMKKCKQCHCEFESHTNSKHCPSCSRDAAISYGYLNGRGPLGRIQSTGRGSAPKDYEKLAFGFRLMGWNDDE